MPCSFFAVSSSALSFPTPLFRMNAPVTARSGARRSFADKLMIAPRSVSRMSASYPGGQPHMRVPFVVRQQAAGEDRPHPDEVGDDQAEVDRHRRDAPSSPAHRVLVRHAVALDTSGHGGAAE